MDELYLEILDLLEKRGDLEKARAGLELLAASEPQSQRVAVLRAALAERQDRLPEALAILETFVAANFDSAVARTNLARLQWKAGEPDKAIATLRFGLMTNPNQERSLHFFAALLEEQGGFEAALSSLRILARTPGAWLPAWVGAQLAISRTPGEVGSLLLLAAEQAREPFPANVPALMGLLRPLPEARQVATALRPYCRSEAQAELDELLAEPRPVLATGADPIRVTCLRRSVWRHISQPQPRSALALAPIVLIKPESWGAQEVAGRLARGFSLLVAETLDALAGGSVAVILETIPQAGVITRDEPLRGAELARAAGSSCEHLVSCYLSFRHPNEYLLDAEIYSSKGDYLGRDSCRAAHPGACLQQLAQRLSANLSEAGATPYPPMPDLEVEDALARETVASLILCAEGALSRDTLANPGLLLDNLVEYALTSQTGPALLTLWAGVEAAARAGLPGGEAQKAAMAEVMATNRGLARWTGRA